MSFAPLVSIITPMFRSGDTLSAALNSLLRQDEWRWESIIVDDGSPDDSRKVAEGFSRRDTRIHLHWQKNAGACAARNTGLKSARGRYVLFLDADDWLEPGALANLVHCCEKKRLSAAAGGFRYARPDGTFTEWTGGYDGIHTLFEALGSSNVLSVPSCVLLRKSVLADIGTFDESLAHCGDWDLWARLARSQHRVGIVNECVTGYRMRVASLSRNPLSLLRDAKIVLNRIHSHDNRVSKPQSEYKSGATSTHLHERIAGFTAYAAALADLLGNSLAADTALNSLSRWPDLSPDRIAEFLIHAACSAHCVGPDHLRPLPREVQTSFERIINVLSRRSGIDDLPARVAAALARLGFGATRAGMQDANRMRLCRPLAADETHAMSYLRSLALQECVA